MYQEKSTTKYLSIVIAAMTFFGIALHDTKIDTMTRFAIALPAVIATYEGANLLHLFGGDSHTHVEKVSVNEFASRHTSLMPRTQTRRDESKKYHLNNGVPRGRYAFDDYNLPIVA
jgi:hypothetical protein